MSYQKLNSPQDLDAFRERALEAEKRFRGRVLICMTGCRSLGAIEIAKAFREQLAEAGMDEEIAVVDVGCHGQCARAPVILIEPQDYLYGGVQTDDVAEIIETTLKNGQPVERLCERSTGSVNAVLSDVPFYKNQQKAVL